MERRQRHDDQTPAVAVLSVANERTVVAAPQLHTYQQSVRVKLDGTMVQCLRECHKPVPVKVKAKVKVRVKDKFKPTLIVMPRVSIYIPCGNER